MVTAEIILRTVAERFQITIEDIKSPCRRNNIQHARNIACYVLRKALKLSLNEIAKEVHRKNHTTVLNSLKTINKYLTSKDDNERAKTFLELIDIREKMEGARVKIVYTETPEIFKEDTQIYKYYVSSL